MVSDAISVYTNRTKRTVLAMSVDGVDWKWLAEGQTGANDPM